MDLKRYQGVFAAAPTPFLADGTVDRKTAAELTGYYIEGGLSGIFALSSTGEYFTMTPKIWGGYRYAQNRHLLFCQTMVD